MEEEGSQTSELRPIQVLSRLRHTLPLSYLLPAAHMPLLSPPPPSYYNPNNTPNNTTNNTPNNTPNTPNNITTAALARAADTPATMTMTLLT